VDEHGMQKIEAIINSMTMAERHNHLIINGSRRKRIARGSGTSVEEINRLLKQFVQTQKLMKTLMGQKKGKSKWQALRMPRIF
jgi:signal recognition particle subunit SRP54